MTREPSSEDREPKPQAKHGPVASTAHSASCQCNGTGQILVGVPPFPMACPGR